MNLATVVLEMSIGNSWTWVPRAVPVNVGAETVPAGVYESKVSEGCETVPAGVPAEAAPGAPVRLAATAAFTVPL